MKRLNWRTFFLGIICSSRALAANPVALSGAGATFPYPLYSKWFSEFEKVNSGVRINYQSIGSGGGIRQFTEGTVDFGASDAPMTDEQLAKVSNPVVHIPTVLGAVAIVYNVPGVPSGLKLSPDVVADLFLGKIKQWDDQRLTKLNPDRKLPGTPVVLAYRSDGSGTTSITTEYLSKVSTEWKDKVGTGTAVRWPQGLGAKGNEGVAGLVKQTPGTLGYVELVYAENNALTYAALGNKAGSFVVPSIASVSAAAAESVKIIPEDFRVSITNAEGKDSYPISSFTYILVHQNLSGPKGEGLQKFLSWAVKEGQALAPKLTYAPLPDAIAKKALAKIAALKVSAKASH